MNAEYEQYLASVSWADKRDERLRLSRGMCESCGANRKIQVHHLTYERIFKEEMDDLMCLCEQCHNELEKLIHEGAVSRHGEPNALRRDSIVALRTLRVVRRTLKKQRKLKARKRHRFINRKEMAIREEFFLKNGYWPKEKNTRMHPTIQYGYNTAKG